MTRTLIRRLGRRGGFLLFLAVLDAVYAYALSRLATPRQRAAAIGPVPWQVWAAAWGAAGAVCLAGAFSRRDVWAFTVAALIKAAWGAVSIWLWMTGRQPNGWLSAVVWGCFAATVLMIASWPEHVSLPPVTGPGNGDTGGRA